MCEICNEVEAYYICDICGLDMCDSCLVTCDECDDAYCPICYEEHYFDE